MCYPVWYARCQRAEPWDDTTFSASPEPIQMLFLDGVRRYQHTTGGLAHQHQGTVRGHNVTYAQLQRVQTACSRFLRHDLTRQETHNRHLNRAPSKESWSSRHPGMVSIAHSMETVFRTSGDAQSQKSRKHAYCTRRSFDMAQFKRCIPSQRSLSILSTLCSFRRGCDFRYHHARDY